MPARLRLIDSRMHALRAAIEAVANDDDVKTVCNKHQLCGTSCCLSTTETAAWAAPFALRASLSSIKRTATGAPRGSSGSGSRVDSKSEAPRVASTMSAEGSSDLVRVVGGAPASEDFVWWAGVVSPGAPPELTRVPSTGSMHKSEASGADRPSTTVRDARIAEFARTSSASVPIACISDKPTTTQVVRIDAASDDSPPGRADPITQAVVPRRAKRRPRGSRHVLSQSCETGRGGVALATASAVPSGSFAAQKAGSSVMRRGSNEGLARRASANEMTRDEYGDGFVVGVFLVLLVTLALLALQSLLR